MFKYYVSRLRSSLVCFKFENKSVTMKITLLQLANMMRLHFYQLLIHAIRIESLLFHVKRYVVSYFILLKQEILYTRSDTRGKNYEVVSETSQYVMRFAQEIFTRDEVVSLRSNLMNEIISRVVPPSFFLNENASNLMTY